MGIVFAWFSAPESVDVEAWNRFLDSYAPVFVILVALTIALTVTQYRHQALKLRIHSVEDVFRPYTPMNALWLGLVGAVLSAVVAGVMYWNMLQTMDSMLGFTLTMLLLTVFICEIISYPVVVKVTKLTPPQYCYRPGQVLQKKGPAR